jgi:hypothetical protein
LHGEKVQDSQVCVKTQALNLTIYSEAMQMMMLFEVLVRASGFHSWLGA